MSLSHKTGRGVWRQTAANQVAPAAPDDYVEAAPAEADASIISNLNGSTPRTIYAAADVQNITLTANNGSGSNTGYTGGMAVTPMAGQDDGGTAYTASMGSILPEN